MGLFDLIGLSEDGKVGEREGGVFGMGEFRFAAIDDADEWPSRVDEVGLGLFGPRDVRERGAPEAAGGGDLDAVGFSGVGVEDDFF